MDKKLPEDGAERQPYEDALSPEQQARLQDTVHRLWLMGNFIAATLQELTGPRLSGATVDRAAVWCDALFATAGKHNDVAVLARMHFFELLNSRAWIVRDQPASSRQIAERALHALSIEYGVHWSQHWTHRNSTDFLSLMERAISAWVDGVQWKQSGGEPILKELLVRAGLMRREDRLDHLKKQWLRWRKRPGIREIAEPYCGGSRPIAASAAKRECKPGPKPKTVAFPREQAERMVDREQHSKEIEEHLFSELRAKPGVTREGIAKLMPRR